MKKAPILGNYLIILIQHCAFYMINTTFAKKVIDGP